MRFCRAVLGLGGLDELREARERGDARRRGLHRLLRLRVRRTCPGRRRRRAFLLFSADLWRDGRFMHGGCCGRRTARPRRLHAQAMVSGGLPLPSGALSNAWVTAPRERNCCRAGVQARPLELKVSPGSTSRTTSPSLRSVQPAARHVGGSAARQLWFEPTPRPWSPPTARCSIVTSYSARAAFGWQLTTGSISARRRRPSPASATASCASACT